jgi:hypothetical protein
MNKNEIAKIVAFTEKHIDSGSWPALAAEQGQRYCSQLLEERENMEKALEKYGEIVRLSGDPYHRAMAQEAETILHGGQHV